MRFQTGRKTPGEPLLSRLDGLAGLPVRPQTARAVLAATAAEAPDVEEPTCVRLPRTLLDLDPGWLIAEQTPQRGDQALHRVAGASWWPATLAADPVAEAVQSLWRHSVATALACRNLARETGDVDPAGLIRAGMLHNLGLWAVAAVDPEWLVLWMSETDPDARRRLETADLNGDIREWGRRLAERWGCEPLVVDAAWLHGEDDVAVSAAARQPNRLALVREAVRSAEATPWALSPPPGRDGMPSEPHLRILIAEVQSRCASPFAAEDSSPQEEAMARENARLQLRIADLARVEASQRRLIEAIADSSPDESPENWSVRAGRLWCGEPEVNAARVVWRSPSPSEDEFDVSADVDESVVAGRGASWTIPLEAAGSVVGEVQLWLDADVEALRNRLGSTRLLDAWKAWASRVADRDLLERRLRSVVSGHRTSVRTESRRIESAKLDGLAEFAAGAGHELNNPLAVIVGRAQLLMTQIDGPDAARSLSIILSQAQRAHRILRDLMFVSRPTEPRLRLIRPADVLQASLADVQVECEARGIQVSSDFEDPEQQAWADPDGLRHIVDSLLRNAVQAIGSNDGGRIQVKAVRRDRELVLEVSDSGKGLANSEAAHLFDPFFCGRQAGRGLGLGLPRAAKLVEQAGGSLTWSSSPSRGTVFQVRLPWHTSEEPGAKCA